MNDKAINFQTIAVDFDGTLCYSQWPELGQPNQALIAYLQEWKRNGIVFANYASASIIYFPMTCSGRTYSLYLAVIHQFFHDPLDSSP